VLGAGKAGRVIVWDAESHRRVWTREVGLHRNDAGSLPSRRILVCPGLLGGVETPLAFAEGRLFVPVVDLCSHGSAVRIAPLEQTKAAQGRGELVALDVRDGRPIWIHRFAQPIFGCATVGDGVVFTSTYGGRVYGLDVRDGRMLWTARLRGGINACPALAGRMLLVGAGIPRGRGSLPEFVAFGTT
jgi:alcohol dehydrogenase (cytochrome c)